MSGSLCIKLLMNSLMDMFEKKIQQQYNIKADIIQRPKQFAHKDSIEAPQRNTILLLTPFKIITSDRKNLDVQIFVQGNEVLVF